MQREFAADVSKNLPSLVPAATSLIHVTERAGHGQRTGAQAPLVSPTRLIELDASMWSSNTVRVTARDVSASTVALAAAPRTVQV